MEKPLIVIPDTHGYLREVEALLLRLDGLGYLRGRRLAFLGDYVDRGPEARLLLDLYMELKSQGHIFIAGNHDYLLAKVVGEARFRRSWITEWTGYEDSLLGNYCLVRPRTTSLMEWEKAANLLREHMPDGQKRFLNELPLVHETESLILVHAGLGNEVPWEEQVDSLKRRSLDPFERPPQIFSPWYAACADNPSTKCLITGHVCSDPPFVSRSRIMLHGGVDNGNGLCAWVEDANEIVRIGRLTHPSSP